MWLGQQAARNPVRSRAGAQTGDVTIEGERAAVMLDSEKRQIPTALPGGYFWKPQQEQEALVLRSGDGLRYVVGLLGEEEKHDLDIKPGEVAILSQGGVIFLLEEEIRIRTEECSVSIKDGSVSISGRLFVNGAEVKGETDGA